ncbi:hypothetical protein B0H15DRAFT_797373 [Mycena belliarum]|uniref:C2H2-type domain-containing protein n=1 Tax=Mycena belliarum TaxID=1033014 RepID=A0AAD6XZA4_9AGAR|nr:hypothetical protein B0H15DRAFT_797373 [Mycena belliae]
MFSNHSTAKCPISHTNPTGSETLTSRGKTTSSLFGAIGATPQNNYPHTAPQQQSYASTSRAPSTYLHPTIQLGPPPQPAQHPFGASAQPTRPSATQTGTMQNSAATRSQSHSQQAKPNGLFFGATAQQQSQNPFAASSVQSTSQTRIDSVTQPSPAPHSSQQTSRLQAPTQTHISLQSQTQPSVAANPQHPLTQTDSRQSQAPPAGVSRHAQQQTPTVAANSQQPHLARTQTDSRQTQTPPAGATPQTQQRPQSVAVTLQQSHLPVIQSGSSHAPPAAATRQAQQRLEPIQGQSSTAVAALKPSVAPPYGLSPFAQKPQTTTADPPHNRTPPTSATAKAASSSAATGSFANHYSNFLNLLDKWQKASPPNAQMDVPHVHLRITKFPTGEIHFMSYAMDPAAKEIRIGPLAAFTKLKKNFEGSVSIFVSPKGVPTLMLDPLPRSMAAIYTKFSGREAPNAPKATFPDPPPPQPTLPRPIPSSQTAATRSPRDADKRFLAHDILRAFGKVHLYAADDEATRYAKRRVLEAPLAAEEPEPLRADALQRAQLREVEGVPMDAMVVDDEDEGALELELEPEQESEPEPEPEPELDVKELKRRRALDDAEAAAMREACTRLQEMPCKWFACGSLLNSLENLVTHLHEVHAQEDDELPTCMWDICGESFADWKQLAQHAEMHVLKTIRCPHQACEEVLRSPRELLAHTLGHTGENSELKPSARPGSFDASLSPPVIPEDPIPPCMVYAPGVQMPDIPEDRHLTLGPWVLRNICAPINARVRRYNAAAQLRGKGALHPDYEFLDTSVLHYSSLPSRPARVRDMANLESKEVSDIIAQGLMVLWPPEGGPHRLDVGAKPPPTVSPLQVEVQPASKVVDEEEMAVESMLQAESVVLAEAVVHEERESVVPRESVMPTMESGMQTSVPQPESVTPPSVLQTEVSQPEGVVVQPSVAQPESVVEPSVLQPENVVQPTVSQPESPTLVQADMAQPEMRLADADIQNLSII